MLGGPLARTWNCWLVASFFCPTGIFCQLAGLFLQAGILVVEFGLRCLNEAFLGCSAVDERNALRPNWRQDAIADASRV